MILSNDPADRRANAARLRAEAKADDRAASEAAENNPTWSAYLAHRARWKRQLANDEDGGTGQ